MPSACHGRKEPDTKPTINPYIPLRFAPLSYIVPDTKGNTKPSIFRYPLRLRVTLMAKALTQLALDNLKPGPVRREIPDGKERGLYYVIQPTGARSWALRYRVSGKPRKLTIGPYPAMGLGKARGEAAKAKVSIAGGNDPAAQKTASRAAQAALRRPPADAVEKVVADFITLYAKPNTRDWRETERLLKQFTAAWEGRQLAAISKADIHRVLDAIVARGAPVQANRAFAQLRKMCRWACSRGLIDQSPCEG